MSWWEQPYAGGKMVPLPGFPRPLYPPDAARYGKQPSSPGPDVEAYKRTVSRLGRWPWQPYDQQFSNAFSLGKPGGNVSDSGIAGVQRQQHLDATGWIGTKTFITLRSARCPQGPHEGEMAMDARAVELLEQAWELYAGHEPAEETGTVRQAALSLARTQLGVTESPSGSNVVLYSDWYGMVGPWCAMFTTWAYETNPLGPSPSFNRGSAYAYCPYIVADARAGRNGLLTTDDPQPGDLVVYDWEGDTVYDHVGLFEEWTSGSGFHAIEGNTSTSNNSNGGEVMRRTRDRYAQGTVFVRVKEPA